MPLIVRVPRYHYAQRLQAAGLPNFICPLLVDNYIVVCGEHNISNLTHAKLIFNSMAYPQRCAVAVNMGVRQTVSGVDRI